MLKYSEVKNLDVQAIDSKIQSLKKELFLLKMQAATAGYAKPHVKKELKRSIAVLLTAKSSK